MLRSECAIRQSTRGWKVFLPILFTCSWWQNYFHTMTGSVSLHRSERRARRRTTTKRGEYERGNNILSACTSLSYSLFSQSLYAQSRLRLIHCVKKSYKLRIMLNSYCQFGWVLSCRNQGGILTVMYANYNSSSRDKLHCSLNLALGSF